MDQSNGEENIDFEEGLCVKCQDPNSKDEKMTIVKDSIEKLLEFCERTGNNSLKIFLQERKGTDRIKIHRRCQKDVYNNLKRKSWNLADQVDGPSKSAKRLERTAFQWKRDCFFCEKACKIDSKHPNRVDWQEVRTLPMREKIIKICGERGDKSELKRRLLCVHDLVAVEGRYHKRCKQEFYENSSCQASAGRLVQRKASMVKSGSKSN